MTLPAQKAFFINKTADSKLLSRSEGVERSRIFSRAQQESHTPSRYGSTGGMSLPEPAEFGVIDSDAEASARKEQRSDTFSRSQILSRRIVTRTTRPQVRLPLPPSYVPSPYGPLNVTDIDPFATAIIPMNRYMAFLLKFYSSTIILRIFPLKSLVSVSRHHTLSLASQDPVALNALLCTTSAALYAKGGDSKHKSSALYYKGQAILYLKQKLSDPDDKALDISSIYAISLLLWIECLQGNIYDMRAHTKGLEHLVTRIGGIQNSPLPIMTTILTCSYLCSAMVRARPALVPALLCEDQVSRPTLDALRPCPFSSLEVMTSRFFEPLNAALLGPEILHLISEQAKCISFKELCVLDQLIPTYEDIQFIYTLQMVVEYRLLSMPFDTVQHPLTSAQESIRLALFVFAQPIISVTESSAAFTRSMARQLKESLERTEMSSLWAPNFDLLLWVLIIGAHIANGQEEYPWLIAHISKLVKILQLQAVDQIEQMLLGFYYFQRSFGPTLANVWNDVQQILQKSERSGSVLAQEPTTGAVIAFSSVRRPETSTGNCDVGG